MRRNRRHRLRRVDTSPQNRPRSPERGRSRSIRQTESRYEFRQPNTIYITRKRRDRLASPVSDEFRSTVRPRLMRTVLRDTTSRIVPRHLRRRHSPDVLARAEHWYSHLATPWPSIEIQSTVDRRRDRLSDQRLHRAEECAKRHIRREVLFALHQLNGRGGRGSPKSQTRC